MHNFELETVKLLDNIYQLKHIDDGRKLEEKHGENCKDAGVLRTYSGTVNGQWLKASTYALGT